MKFLDANVATSDEIKIIIYHSFHHLFVVLSLSFQILRFYGLQSFISTDCGWNFIYFIGNNKENDKGKVERELWGHYSVDHLKNVRFGKRKENMVLIITGGMVT